MRVDWTIYVSFLGALVVLLLPRDAKNLIRWVALLAGVAGLVVALQGFFGYHAWVTAELAAHGRLTDGFKQLVDRPWIPALGARYHLAVDGINYPLLVLNGFVCVTGILFSWNIEYRTKEFFAFFLVLIAGVYGVFMAMDLFLLFVFYELAIIPKYFIIAIWGSTRKEYGAMKLVLYSFVGSALVFIGALALFYAAGGQTFGILELAQHGFSRPVQIWVFPLMFVGFAVLAGMWPLHTWAPTGHVAAPTAASMLLAGVVMKLGSYGCLRAAMLLFPEGLAYWKWAIATLAVIGIVYGAGVALVQKDFKFIIGYSSVSHMGFVLLGLATLNAVGMSGAILQMFSHGIVASLLFAVVGRMVYDRTHTRQLSELGGLAKALPFACFTFVVGGAASMGLPGFSGFWAELQVLIGAFSMSPWLAAWAGVGILLTVAYILNAIHKVFYADGPGGHSTGHGAGHGAEQSGSTGWQLPPISLPEKVAALILMALLVIVGLYPSILLTMIRANVELFLGENGAMTGVAYGDIIRALGSELVLVLTALVALVFDLGWARHTSLRERTRTVGFLVLCGLLLSLVPLLQQGTGAGVTGLGGTLLNDGLAVLFKAVIIVLTGLAVLLSLDHDVGRHVGEYYAVMLFGAVGMLVLVNTAELLTIFVALELLSICLYILTAAQKSVLRSQEAALKYFLFGAISSAFLFFGISYLVGITGTTSLPAMTKGVGLIMAHPAGEGGALLGVALLFLLVGLGFKVAVVPFHLWAPDAYEGAPTPVTAYIATGSKVASFVVLLRLLLVGLVGAEGSAFWGKTAPGWALLLAVMAVLSMLLGNLAALVQNNVKRLLAYSSIAHAGYILIGLIAATAMGAASVLFYVIVYSLTNLGAFGVVAALTRDSGKEDLGQFNGMARRAPFLSFLMLIFVLSLAGVPPLGGFFAKFYVFAAAVQRDGTGYGLLWLVALGIVMSAVSLYYYLVVLKHFYVAEATDPAPVRTPTHLNWGLGLVALAVVLLGVYPQPLLALLNQLVSRL